MFRRPLAWRIMETPGGTALTLFVMLLILMWLGTVGSAVIVARARLGAGDASWRDEALVRALAFGAASAALGGFGLAGTIVTDDADVFFVVAPAWIISALLLCLPPLARSDGSVRVSSQAWVFCSMGAAVLGGLAMALFVLIRLILSGPELV